MKQTLLNIAALVTLGITGSNIYNACKSDAPEYKNLRTEAAYVQTEKADIYSKISHAKSAIEKIASNPELKVKELSALEVMLSGIQTELKNSKNPEVYAPAISVLGSMMYKVSNKYGANKDWLDIAVGAFNLFILIGPLQSALDDEKKKKLLAQKSQEQK